MRIKITLHALHSATELPLNYQHAVASLIYARLSSGSLSFAAQLHDIASAATTGPLNSSPFLAFIPMRLT